MHYLREIPQSYHTVAVFDSHQMDDLYKDPWNFTKKNLGWDSDF